MSEKGVSTRRGHLAREQSVAACAIRSWRTVRRLSVPLILAILSAPAARGATPNVAADRDYIGPLRPPVGAATSQPIPAEPFVSVPSTGPLTIGVEQAIFLGLEQNQQLRVQRLTPPIRRTGEQVERAAFDPTLTAGFSASRTRTEQESAVTGERVKTTSNRADANVGISEFLPTGTNINLGASASRSRTTGGPASYNTRADITITQALLQGGGWDALNVNLASLRQARLDSLSSEYELRGFAQSLLASIEETYWNYALALRQIEIYTDSLNLAKEQLGEVEERIAVGKLAETERAAAQAEVALREEDLINARSTVNKTRLTFLRTLNPPSQDLWSREVVLRDQPASATLEMDDVEAHVKVGLRMRPDLNQARLSFQRGELDVVKTRNGLLPRLDAFITLGRTGYADSFGGSVRGEDGRSYDGTVGADFSYPLLNRGARARYDRSRLSLDQSQESLRNMEQLIQVDVRTAYIEVVRLAEQTVATAATRKLQESNVRSETEKFRVGKSTTLLVGRAQRDLLSAQIDEIRAVVGHLNGLVELYRLEGSLLERRGISAPGREPVNELATAKR